MLALKAGLRGSAQKRDDGTATALLSEMQAETFASLEQEKFRCEMYDAKTSKQMRTMRNAVVTFNAQAASARACVVKCSGDIATFTETLQQTEEDARRLKKQCDEDLFKLRYELTLTTSDIAVMNDIIKALECGGEKVGLLQCKHCQNGAVMLHQVPHQISKLKSAAVRESVQKVLSSAFEESPDGGKPIALAQLAQRDDPDDDADDAASAIPAANLSRVPELP